MRRRLARLLQTIIGVCLGLGACYALAVYRGLL